jgi:hypothetical protein
MKDGCRKIAHKAEHAVDLETGALVRVTMGEGRQSTEIRVDASHRNSGQSNAAVVTRHGETHARTDPLPC